MFMHLWWKSCIKRQKGIRLLNSVIHDDRVGNTFTVDSELADLLQNINVPITFESLYRNFYKDKVTFSSVKMRLQELYDMDLVSVSNKGIRKLIFPNNVIIWFPEAYKSILSVLGIFLSIGVFLALLVTLFLSLLNFGIDPTTYALWMVVFGLSLGVHEVGHCIAHIFFPVLMPQVIIKLIFGGFLITLGKKVL